MSELFDLSKKWNEQKAALNRTTQEIRDWADAQGYEQAAYIDDPVHFEVAGIKFTPKRIVGEACAESPQDTDSTETIIIDEASDIDPVKFAEPVQPMADLSGEASGVDWQTGMIKPEAFNGLAPETD